MATGALRGHIATGILTSYKVSNSMNAVFDSLSPIPSYAVIFRQFSNNLRSLTSKICTEIEQYFCRTLTSRTLFSRT